MERPAACPTDAQLEAWAHRRLDPQAMAELEAHLPGCASCRAAHQALADSGRTLPARAPPEDPPASASQPSAAYRPVLDEDGVEIELGRGGIGRVLLVTDEVLGRDVAMKVLLPQHLELGPEESRGLELRFVREARVTGQLEHPAIVPVYALGRRADGALFYTMRRVRGRTLADAIAHADGLDARLALMPHFLAACQAVAFAHSRAVVHRDLKPQNVMLDRYGETSVVDWGLAAARGQAEPTPRPPSAPGETGAIRLAPDLTSGADEVVVGTPAYMSPEQAAGKIAAVDERSDVWGLGAMLFEVLTGRPPRVLPEGGSLEPMQALPVPLVLSVQPDAPRDLAAICAKALSVEPSQRYATAEAMVADVDAWVHGRRVAAYEYRALEVLGRLARRHKAPLLVALVGLAAVAAVAADSWRRVRAERDEARELAQLVFGDVAAKLAPVPGALPLVESVTQRALAFYERLLRAQSVSPAEREQMTRAVVRLHHLNNSLGRFGEAARLGALCEQLVGDLRPEVRASPGLLAYAVNCQVGLASTAFGLGKAAEATRHLDEAERRAGLGSPGWSDRTWRGACSALWSRRFQLAYQASELERAKQYAARELQLDEASVAAEPDDPTWRQNLSNSLRDAALVAMATDDSAQGLAWGARAIAVIKDSPGWLSNSDSLAMLAAALTQQAQFVVLAHLGDERRRALEREAAETYERLLRLEPQLVEPRHDYALLLLRSGDAEKAYGEYRRLEASAAEVDVGEVAMAALLSGRPEDVLARRAALEARGRHLDLWVLAVALAVTGAPGEAATAARSAARDAEPFTEWPHGELARYAASLRGPTGLAVGRFAAEYQSTLDAEAQDWPALLERFAAALDALAAGDGGTRAR